MRRRRLRRRRGAARVLPGARAGGHGAAARRAAPTHEPGGASGADERARHREAWESPLPPRYHDSETGACERFVYGGCAGNENNFTTQAACERACPLCDDSLCAEYQSCQLFRDPRCRERQKRCERICGDGCEQSCDPVPFCADTCDRGACPENTRCELVPVTCVREPCPPARECVPIEDERCGDTVCRPFQECLRDPLDGERYCADNCDEGACLAGSVCTLEPVECVTTPCPPVRRCAPRDPCTGVQCLPGQRCVVNQVGDPICVRD